MVLCSTTAEHSSRAVKLRSTDSSLHFTTRRKADECCSHNPPPSPPRQGQGQGQGQDSSTCPVPLLADLPPACLPVHLPVSRSPTTHPSNPLDAYPRPSTLAHIIHSPYRLAEYHSFIHPQIPLLCQDIFVAKRYHQVPMTSKVSRTCPTPAFLEHDLSSANWQIAIATGSTNTLPSPDQSNSLEFLHPPPYPSTFPIGHCRTPQR